VARDAAAADPDPVVGCWVSPGWSTGLTVACHEDWREPDPPQHGAEGLTGVIVARRARPQRVSVCGYLVDTYCLGVKNALGPETMNDRDLPAFRRGFFAAFEGAGEPLAAPLEMARHLVWGAVDHARQLGFEPHRDFDPAAGHLGGPWQDTSAITFGRDGVPFYISGPHDNPNAVLRTLTRSVGEDGFDFLAAVGG
ncbi:MAG: helix-turn-helix domain-containing protein, partial [Actinomycetota bacterium]|nr:helix-turn-helix domain-containing protein [Actinomycetota bacterium]